MKEEQIFDLESQRVLLRDMNLRLKQQFQTEQQTLQKLDHQRPYHKTPNIMTVIGISITILFALSLYSINTQFLTKNADFVYTGQYTIENLRGDTIDTWKHWNILENEKITVNIINPEVTKAATSVIVDAIMSDETVQIDDSLMHKGLQGSTSTYYKGWHGALKEASKKSTQFYIPTEFVMLESSNGEGDITIRLLTEKNTDGYSGYTKSITDNDQILKSTITIYDVDSLSTEDISTIIRHEFGHALGLAHSTAPEDLMAPVITTNYPYISECDIDAISALYDGKASSQVVCQK